MRRSSLCLNTARKTPVLKSFELVSGHECAGQVIESENMYSNKRNRQGKKFFLAYFAVIAILFLWNLFHCTGISWESRETYLQSVTDETSIKPEDGDVLSAIEIKDGNTVIVKTQSGEEFKPGKKSRLRGIELLGYENRNSLRLTDETISAEVYSSGDHEKLLSGSYLLCNQTLYPTDETNMYIAFSDRAAAEKGQGGTGDPHKDTGPYQERHFLYRQRLGEQ